MNINNQIKLELYFSYVVIFVTSTVIITLASALLTDIDWIINLLPTRINSNQNTPTIFDLMIF